MLIYCHYNNELKWKNFVLLILSNTDKGDLKDNTKKKVRFFETPGEVNIQGFCY